MAIWIDDLMPRRDEWLDMSFQARVLLIDLWCAVKVAKGDGYMKESRLPRESDAWSPETQEELVTHGWIHIGQTGCGTEHCPAGMHGFVLFHNYLARQESSLDQKRRQAIDRERKRDAAKATNHKRWHVDRGISDIACDLCHPQQTSRSGRS
jgi:hypothetical protein